MAGHTGNRRGRIQINFQLYQQVGLTCHVPMIAGGDLKKGQEHTDMIVGSNVFKLKMKPHLKKQHKGRKHSFFFVQIYCILKETSVLLSSF